MKSKPMGYMGRLGNDVVLSVPRWVGFALFICVYPWLLGFYVDEFSY